MSPGGAEIWFRLDGGGLILNVQSLTLAHAYVIRAARDGIETQVGASRIFRKKRTSETVFAEVET